jgi:type III secretory pathway component EscV
MLALLHTLLAGEDAATEGKKVITGMLIVGLVIVAVIALGETTHWLRHRRR